MRNLTGLAMLGVALSGGVALAADAEFGEQMAAFVAEKGKVWTEEAVLIDAIRAQNAAHAELDAAAIETLDQAWRAEVVAAEQPTIAAMLESDASKHLIALREQSEGLLTEIFIMDAHGLNVAMSDITSDYFQGDEAKWQDTYQKGADAVHYGEVELDESTQAYQSQVSLTIVDPETGEPIGAVTYGLNLEFLE